jgi:tRNA(Ile)-lysidine synthase
MLDALETFADKHDMFPRHGLILAAVSGGADSMCLLAALLELSEKRGFSVAAMHFNHRLRGEESERDARFVERFCLDRDISLFSGGGDVRAVSQMESLGIEEAARRLRYDFFYETAKNIDAKRIATAHTADDNAETLLLNLTRGAGLAGLGGIPPVRGMLIRPMLSLTRDDVMRFIAQRDIPFVEDSTNKLDIYSRNIIRHNVIPVLGALNPRLMTHISSTAALLREDEAYLSSIAEKFIQEHCRGSSDTQRASVADARALSGLPRPISSRVIRLIYGNNLSSGHIASVLELCDSGKVSGEVALPSGIAYREYDRIVFSHDTRAVSFAPADVKIGGKTEIPELGLTVKCLPGVCSDTARKGIFRTEAEHSEKINESFTTFLFKYDNICGKIVIRPRQTGDIISIFGRNGAKTLKKLFIEQRIPMRKRALIPVLADDKGVLAVCGADIFYLDGRAVCETGDQALEIIFEETAYEK